ncbi:MAG: short-chain dehydrogenase [Rhodospirillaceae bacterium]|nr:short-chain dehydrogenase [Rhodospirillaceae bacterium]
MSKHIIDLSGKVALITGGSRGLGREIALGFAEAGADVAITSRKKESCEPVAQEILAIGRRAFAYGCHVGYWDQVNGLIDAVYNYFGKVDVLINNAGMSPLYDRPNDIPESLWDKVQEVNLKGPFRLCAEVGQRMLDAGAGSIINVSSTGAIRPTGGIIPYAAAKAGLNAMTEAFAQAYGPNVRVNGIMPGPFLTDISKAWDMEKFAERARTRIAMKRGGKPDEVVAAALYLASDHAGYTTGSIMRIDGGST